MSSSTFSSDTAALWRRFLRLAVGTAVLAVAMVYAFVVLVDPFDILPLSPPADRAPVATNARFSFPALARSEKFDSAVIGTSTSRLLRPAVLDAVFGARFANLAMNDATVHEQSRMLSLFARAHPAARLVLIGLDVRRCVTGEDYEKLTFRSFPEWMYDGDRWRGYGEMLNLFAVQEAGQQFGILSGITRRRYGRDGYTSFVPPDSEYDPARVALHLRAAEREIPPGERSGAATTWRYPAIEQLGPDLSSLADNTRKILFFVPYHHVLMSPPGSPGALVWNECKRRVARLAARTPNALALDFMLPSPITESDDNYWDALHTRVGIADRLARDLAAAERGEASADFRVLSPEGTESARR
jgi:hypothetical protein